ncbi:hypothetical protein [Pinirhizobacter sp.]|uniref:hypothetical protein n=1 Tax=Pinirhizobacter sp. TaxID=2950432 RepID=UPI002F426761
MQSIIGMLRAKDVLMHPRPNVISNVIASITPRDALISRPPPNVGLTPSGIDAFDRAASRAAAEMFEKYPGLVKLKDDQCFQEKLGPWALVLEAMKGVEGDKGLSDNASRAYVELVDRVTDLSDLMDRGTLSIQKQTTRVNQVDKLARQAFLELGPQEGFAELTRSELYQEVITSVAGTNGGNLDGINDVVGELNERQVDQWLQMVDMYLTNSVGLRRAMEAFFTIPQLLKRHPAQQNTSPVSPGAETPSAWPSGMPAGGNYAHTGAVTVTNDFGRMNDVFEKIFALLEPLIRHLADKVQSVAASQTRDPKISDTQSRDEQAERGVEVDAVPSRRYISMGVDSLSDELGAKDEDKELTRQLGEVVIEWETFKDRAGIASVSSELTNIRSESDQSAGGEEIVQRPSTLEFRMNDDTANRSSDRTPTPDYSRGSTAHVEIPLPPLFTPSTPTRSSASQPSQSISFQGRVLGSRGYSLDPVGKVDEEGRARDTQHVVKMTTSATGPSASLDELLKTGKDADESGYRDAVRGAWLYQNEWAKGKADN